MANLRLATASQAAMLNAIRDKIDAGAGAGTIKFYTASQPANANTAISGQTLIGTLTYSDPAASTTSTDTLTFSAITDDSTADASGTITWARIADSTGATVFDCDVNTSGATINMSSVAVNAGDILRITSFTLTQPAG